MESSFPNHHRRLPFEIVEEILLQLPVKSLLRFRCVSKSWLALISDPKFVKSHLKCSTTKQDHHHDLDHVLISSSTSLLQSVHIHVQLNLNNTLATKAYTDAEAADTEAEAAAEGEEGTTDLEALDFPVSMSHPVKDIKIVGSCNGLACLVLDSERIITYNPSTRHVHEVPTLSFTKGKDYFYGFGYDSCNHDCKIVRATSSSRDGNFLTEIDIFTFKTNAWRRIKSLPFYLLFNLAGTLLNGAFHWAVRRGKSADHDHDHDHDRDRRPFVLVSFDLTKETYREVELPGDGDKDFSFYGLGVLGGCLSMLHSPHGSDYQVWVMKEYGVKSSWTVFTTIPQKMDSEFMGLMSLLCILKNGEILMLLHQRKLVIYNPVNRKFRTILNGDIDSSQVALYMETLVSPNMHEVIEY